MRRAFLRAIGPRLFGHELRGAEMLGILAILAGGFLQLFVIRRAIAFTAQAAPDQLPVLFFAGVAAAGLFARFRATDLSETARIFARGVALLAIIYAAVEPFDFPIPDPAAAAWASPYLIASRLLAFVCGAIAWWRPSFLLPALLYGAVNRSLMVALTHVVVSSTDLATFLEVGLFTSSIGFTLPLALAVARSRHDTGTTTTTSWPQLGAELVVAAAIGGHLGSYFHSGVAKLQLDGGLLSWILDNQTQQGILIGLERGAQPFAAFPRISQRLYDLMSYRPALPTALVVTAQLAAVMAMLRRRLLMGFTLIYDAFHAGVYLVYGLLFWKWVLVNLLIFGTFFRSRKAFTTGFILTGLGTTLFGYHAFWTARLAWYDSANLLSTYVEAIDAQGRSVRVPAAAFGTLSYPFSHGLIYIPAGMSGQFPAVRWGSYFNYKALLTSRQCELPTGYDPLPSGIGSLDDLRSIISARHDQLLRRADADGRVSLYAYPHHHYPSPFAHQEFRNLDLRTVTGYRWVIESVCLSMADGQLQRRVIERDEFDLGPVS